MKSYLRLRQICLAVPRLQPVEDDIVAILGTSVCFRDPNVAPYGLENALFPLGPDILELVAPTQNGTAAGRFIERSAGRGGYMAILDCDDIDARKAHVEAMGVRIANAIQHDGYVGLQLHPRDCRAAMLEFNHTLGGEALTGPFHPAGPDWPSLVRPNQPPLLRDVEVEASDPLDLARHWARIMDVPLADGPSPSIHLTHGSVRFVPAGEPGVERLIGLTIQVPDPDRALSVATERGLVGADGQVWLGGVRLRFVR